ncbi:FAD-dependent oxidoreductase [Pseudomonas fluorescens HK44]|uniref:FAD-dependent oxidoreductase n=1 Tax=Pseudomonas fluorescens HK44 TaxID=1042209 RepID=A0A010S5S2_PSEFL|nr:FAD-dependent oxidoreductase [Pseudomonas fluorescens]EXF95894.1 FAD-dependent oxidoreductase [Pseudomonas fluorescens HK44]
MSSEVHPLRQATVIGGGIVGLCVAFHLLKTGVKVTVIERTDPGSGCSAGNAGSLSAGSVAPLAMPGVLKQASGMLFDPTGPLYIPTNYLLRVAPWIARFVASARPARVAEIAHSLHSLIGDAVEQHKKLAAKADCLDLIVETGQLHLYPNDKAFAKDTAGWALKISHGLDAERVGRSDIQRLEPAVGKAYQLGYYLPDQPWVKDPRQYSKRITDFLKASGVEFVRDRVNSLTRHCAGWTLDGENGFYQAEKVVIAAGTWSAQLLKKLRLSIPLETQRGYHVRYPYAQNLIQRVVVLADRKVFITPMQNGLRAAGTVEFGGLDLPPSIERARLLAGHAKAAFPSLDIHDPIEWMGHRPCLPDSLPVLGELPQHPGLWCAFGHGHLGLTGAAGTGALIAQAMTGSLHARAALAPFSATRF